MRLTRLLPAMFLAVICAGAPLLAMAIPEAPLQMPPPGPPGPTPTPNPTPQPTPKPAPTPTPSPTPTPTPAPHTSLGHGAQP